MSQPVVVYNLICHLFHLLLHGQINHCFECRRSGPAHALRLFLLLCTFARPQEPLHRNTTSLTLGGRTPSVSLAWRIPRYVWKCTTGTTPIALPHTGIGTLDACVPDIIASIHTLTSTTVWLIKSVLRLVTITAPTLVYTTVSYSFTLTVRKSPRFPLVH
jgi:hypothetical protein